jgi:hypothetical protein
MRLCRRRITIERGYNLNYSRKVYERQQFGRLGRTIREKVYIFNNAHDVVALQNADCLRQHGTCYFYCGSFFARWAKNDPQGVEHEREVKLLCETTVAASHTAGIGE